MIEVLKQMVEALREYHYYTINAGLPNQSMLNKGYAAYQAGLKAIAELESQEPDYWLGYGLQAHTEKPFENATALYTHPSQRTWVGLSEQQRNDIENDFEAFVSKHVFDAIEAKLKQKNGYVAQETNS